MKALNKSSQRDIEQANRLQQNDIESSDDDSEHYITPVISAGMKIEEQKADFEKTAKISANQELFADDSIITEKFIINPMTSPMIELRESTITGGSTVDLNLEELKEEKVELFERRDISKTIKNPSEILKKIREVNLNGFLNLSATKTEKIIKDHYTISNLETPVKEIQMKKAKINSYTVYSKVGKSHTLQTPKAKTTSMLSSAEKIARFKVKNQIRKDFTKSEDKSEDKASKSAIRYKIDSIKATKGEKRGLYLQTARNSLSFNKFS